MAFVWVLTACTSAERERWASHQLPGTAEMRAEAKAEAPVGGGSRHHTAQLPRRER